MARKPSTPKGPTPIESIEHDAKRSNIPTSPAQDFVTPEVEAIQQVIYERDPSLDPQLVWREKYPHDRASDGERLVVDAPPIYIQEKIDPRVLVENLRCHAKTGEPEPELTLFDAFDGLDELDAVDFYQHETNWSNRMILGDSLQVMSSLAEREDLRGKVQMVYIDPPYGIKFGSNWQASARKRDVQDGKPADLAREVEQIKAFRDTWELGIHSYLSYLRDRLIITRELLTESGSCFVQIGDENVHLVRSLLDEIFGSDNFVSMIPFKKTSSFSGARLDGINDYILWYAKSVDSLKYRNLFVESDLSLSAFPRIEEGHSSRAATVSDIGTSGSRYRTANLTSSGVGSTTFPFELDGIVYSPSRGTHWKTNLPGMENLRRAGRLTGNGKTLAYKRYHSDFPVRTLTNWWDDTVQSTFAIENLYVVQTYTRVIARCMLMCTDPGDLVIDPTCGSGTTAFVAEQWGRRWITMDTSRVAITIARQRLMAAKFPYYILADSEKGHQIEQRETGKLIPPSAYTGNIKAGFVYKRVQRITLKSIANNPDVVEGMSREEIDAAIRRHADYELLYDRPYEDKGVVRVAGRFTVESLSPHRSLAFSNQAQADPASQTAGRTSGESASFEQTILENLRAAGVQNGRTSERIRFETLDPHAGNHLQAIGQATSGTNPLKVGVAIGPQYGTVDAKFIKEAAREAIQNPDVDLLCVLGFAFDPQATGTVTQDGVAVESGDAGFAQVAGERHLGRLNVLLVRMNSDLLMGDELKKTGSGNLFTVFGEPDIDITRQDGDLVVALNGVDVYDPTTGEIRSNDTSRIALWMIDTDYNEESFFVRHCYFTGGNDPYKRLKTALKAEINQDAWGTLYSTTSRPFPAPTSGKIAVKVINDYGDEVMKVFTID